MVGNIYLFGPAAARRPARDSYGDIVGKAITLQNTSPCTWLVGHKYQKSFLSKACPFLCLALSFNSFLYSPYAAKLPKAVTIA